MKKGIGKLFFKLMGWKFDISVPVNDIPKSVLIAAPHTSNWDFFYAIFAFWYLVIPLKFFIKDSWTKPWYGFLFTALGGYGIDRSQRANMTDFAADLLQKSDHLYLLNTPEASRSRAEKWKTGFYYIAKKAEVPILLSYCDYEKKISGIGKVIYLKDQTREEVLTEIEEFYKPIKGKFPENYNPKIF
jgi:1-acyl-sn-glycerol-3-phosphate acyltransferase